MQIFRSKTLNMKLLFFLLKLTLFSQFVWSEQKWTRNQTKNSYHSGKKCEIRWNSVKNQGNIGKIGTFSFCLYSIWHFFSFPGNLSFLCLKNLWNGITYQCSSHKIWVALILSRHLSTQIIFKLKLTLFLCFFSLLENQWTK